ncbi:transposase [uncultured Parasutterella sp.]|uniref:IS66 family transposase n=1 Tax=Parasutterella muris TaxID=2565572 RepID=UPI0033903252
MRTFLDYEDIPLFTNKVENAIRPITILRKNCLFQHSPKYMEGMCMAYSTWRLSKIIRSRDRRSG